MEKEDYFKCEEKFFANLTLVENNNILFYCVTGSLARNDLTLGWSDIDIILVIKKFTPQLFVNLKVAKICKYPKYIV